MNDWKGGYPKTAGHYDCLVDGERQSLKHFICVMSGRHEWVDTNGDYIYADVKWRDSE